MNSKGKIGDKGFEITMVLMGLGALFIIVLMIVAPLSLLKLYIKRTLITEYKYTNADLALVELLSYPEIRKDIMLYVSGLDGVDEASLKSDISSVLDNLISSGCYKLYYYSGSENIILLDKEGESINGETCETKYFAKTFVITPYGQPSVKLGIEIS